MLRYLRICSGRKATYFFVRVGYTDVSLEVGGWFLYLDVLGALNFVVDFLLLTASNRLSGHGTSVGRTILAAALGGVYGCVCVLPGWRFLGSTFWRVVFLTLIGGIAFGFCRRGLRRSALFLLLSMAVGGIAIGLGSSFGVVILSAGVVCLLCVFGLRGRLGSKYLPISIQWEGKKHHFQALVDTGNTLSDPITGQQAVVVSPAIGEKILGISRDELKSPLDCLQRVKGGRLIPYHAVGNSGGLLLAKQFSNVTIGSRTGSCLIAFAPYDLGMGEGYEALTGGIEWV